jgi:hypothetical protein
VITVEIDALMCIEIALGAAIAAFVVFIGRAVLGFLAEPDDVTRARTRVSRSVIPTDPAGRNVGAAEPAQDREEPPQ